MNLAVVIQLLCFLVDVSEDREEGGADRTDMADRTDRTETNMSFEI